MAHFTARAVKLIGKTQYSVIYDTFYCYNSKN
jgi:hypothetical protein